MELSRCRHRATTGIMRTQERKLEGVYKDIWLAALYGLQEIRVSFGWCNIATCKPFYLLFQAIDSDVLPHCYCLVLAFEAKAFSAWTCISPLERFNSKFGTCVDCDSLDTSVASRVHPTFVRAPACCNQFTSRSCSPKRSRPIPPACGRHTLTRGTVSLMQDMLI